MQSKFINKSTFKASALPMALFIFLFSTCMGNAQALYADLGPASFSRNWDTSSRSNPYVPQEVRQRVYPTSASVALISQGPATTSPSLPGNFSQPTVPGSRAVLRHGIAYAPEAAPLCVKKAIWATNTLLRKPYVWGGGHDSFFDPRGYDCSGTVSFALHYAGQLSSPTDSHSLMNFGEPGRGRWMTIYAGNGHTWMEIAGLRLDTTGNYGNEGPRWRLGSRSSWGYATRHPSGL